MLCKESCIGAISRAPGLNVRSKRKAVSMLIWACRSAVYPICYKITQYWEVFGGEAQFLDTINSTSTLISALKVHSVEIPPFSNNSCPFK